MTAQLHPATTPIDRPWYALVAVALELFTALGAIPVGIMLITDPTGAGVGFPPGWIEATPFGSYLVPGIYLLAMNGVGMLVLAGLTLMRHWVAPWLTGVLGTGLAIWIGVQLIVMPEVSFLQAIFGVIGARAHGRRRGLAAQDRAAPSLVALRTTLTRTRAPRRPASATPRPASRVLRPPWLVASTGTPRGRRVG